MLNQLAPPGFEARLRAAEPSAERDDMDAKVEAAGGSWQAVPLPQSKGLRPGRLVARAQPPQYVYLIPREAFDTA
jgi:hypothetical protein